MAVSSVRSLPAQAHVHAVVAQEEALLPGSAERGAVCVTLAEVGVPRVEMRVEVHQGKGTVAGRGRAQQGKGDRVIAADGDEVRALSQEGPRARRNLGHRLFGAEGGAGDVPGVDHLGQGEGQRIDGRVVRPQEPRRLAHRGRAEASARPVAGPTVEGDPDDPHVPSGYLFGRGKSGEGGEAGEARLDAGVRRADRTTGVRHQPSRAWYTSDRS
jgi:hypothetical protein